MARVKRLGVLSFARFQAAILGIVGLLAGILYSFGGLIIDVLVTLGWVSPAAASTPGLSAGTVLAFGALIAMPLIAASIGVMAGLVEAVLYNSFARWFGGIDLQIEE